MAKLAGKVYGEALFSLAVEENRVDEFLLEAREIQNCVLCNDELNQFMNHPGVSKEKKIALMENVIKDQLSKEMLGFLVIVIDKGHYDELGSMITYFKNQVKAYKKIGVVYITTPTELRNEQKAKIEDKILSTTDYLKLEAHYILDESLIGGMIIRMQDRVIDSSLKTKLEKLQKDLLKTRVS